MSRICNLAGAEPLLQLSLFSVDSPAESGYPDLSLSDRK